MPAQRSLRQRQPHPASWGAAGWLLGHSACTGSEGAGEGLAVSTQAAFTDLGLKRARVI